MGLLFFYNKTHIFDRATIFIILIKTFMTLPNLRKLYKNLKENDEAYYIFDYKKNNVCFEVLFDIFNSPFELHFILKESDFSFRMTVHKGFHINEYLDKNIYKRLCEILMLKYDEQNPFSTKVFLRSLIQKFLCMNSELKRKESYLNFM